jgi:Cd2+/Zn2+-exporting ATPase
MRRHWLEQMLVLRWAGCGTQAALEATDIVLMADDLLKIVIAHVIARRTYCTIQENLFVNHL